jgi:CDP-4-dehydro-6-deoxyglucose reductase
MMPTVWLRNGKHFEAQAGISILDAALAAGLALEHSCRTGRCGSCRARLTAGNAAPTLAEEGLAGSEHDRDIILTCARTARSDLHLDIEDLGRLAGMRSRTLPCRIHELQHLSDDVLRVTLRLPPGADFSYLSGQHVRIIAPGGTRRSYSLASSPQHHRATGLLALEIRRVEGGVLSGYWFDRARANDLLRLEGPLGTFFLRDVAGLDVVFLATGTGIAPIRAMMDDLATLPTAEKPSRVRLLWGGRTLADLYGEPHAPLLEYTPVLSRAETSWLGARGHVQDVLLRSPLDVPRTVVYACGSPQMVQGARATLLAEGLASGNFHADAFVCSTTQPGHG